MHYAIKTEVNDSYLDNRGDNVTGIEFDSGNPEDSYMRPSNVSEDGSFTTHFNEEFDEWTRETNENSIFNNFHKRYIQGIYSKHAKKFDLKAYLPPIIFSKLKLSDTLIIDRVSYNIESMDVNVNKSLTKLSLIKNVQAATYVGITEEQEKGNLEFEVFVTAGETVNLPYTDKGFYEGYIDFGDGKTSPNSLDTASHTYDTGGTYTITVKGRASEIDFSVASVDESMYTKIKSFGNNTRISKLDISGTNIDLSEVSDIPKFEEDFDITNLINGSSSEIKGIESWDLGKTTSLNRLFKNNTVFNQEIGGWNTSNVTHIGGIFDGATSFNQYIGQWDTRNVVEMLATFNGATSFNQSLSGWDTSNVCSMSYMFNGANSFNQDISGWNFSCIEDMTGFMSNSSYNPSYYDNLLVALDESGQEDVVLDMIGINYTTAGSSARASLITKGWTITDGGVTGI